MIGTTNKLAKIGGAILALTFATSPALAAPTSATSSLQSTRAATDSAKMMREAISKWFEAYDQAIADQQITAQEKYILSRPINQEFERVKEFTQVAGNIAVRYRNLVETLKSTPLQANWPGVQALRDGTIDFYSDEAGVYEDLIKPHPPAKTKEELDQELNDLQSRTQAIKNSSANLLSMDRQLRQQFGVHEPQAIDKRDQISTSKSKSILPAK